MGAETFGPRHNPNPLDKASIKEDRSSYLVLDTGAFLHRENPGSMASGGEVVEIPDAMGPIPLQPNVEVEPMP